MQRQNQTDGWIVTVATIIACNRNFWTSLTGGADAYGEMASDTFVVEYSYRVGDRTFRGKYRSNTPREIGRSFDKLRLPASGTKYRRRYFSKPLGPSSDLDSWNWFSAGRNLGEEVFGFARF
jgi:hypothetical protein